MNITKVLSGFIVLTAVGVCVGGWKYQGVARWMPSFTPTISPLYLKTAKGLKSLKATERSYGLPSGILIALAEKESKARLGLERTEEHLKRTDSRIRKLAKTQPHLVAIASTSYGVYQQLGIDAITAGVPISELKNLDTATELAAKRMSEIYRGSRYVDAKSRLFDSFLAWNCGYHIDDCKRLKPGKKGFDMAYLYAKDALRIYQGS